MKTKKLLLLAVLPLFLLSCDEDFSLKKAAYYTFNVTDVANMIGKSYAEETVKLKDYLNEETGDFRAIYDRDKFTMTIKEGSNKKIERIMMIAYTNKPDYDMFAKYNRLVAEKAELNYVLCDKGSLDDGDYLLYPTFGEFLKALNDGKIPKNYEFTADYTMDDVDIYIMYSTSHLGIVFMK